MAENIYELFPLFPHHIFHPVCLCVVRNKSLREGWGGEGKKAVQGLGLHPVPGTLVVPGLGVPWPQACLLLSEVPPPPRPTPSCYSEEVFWREGFKCQHRRN